MEVEVLVSEKTIKRHLGLQICTIFVVVITEVGAGEIYRMIFAYHRRS